MWIALGGLGLLGALIWLGMPRPVTGGRVIRLRNGRLYQIEIFIGPVSAVDPNPYTQQLISMGFCNIYRAEFADGAIGVLAEWCGADGTDWQVPVNTSVTEQ